MLFPSSLPFLLASLGLVHGTAPNPQADTDTDIELLLLPASANSTSPRFNVTRYLASHAAVQLDNPAGADVAGVLASDAPIHLRLPSAAAVDTLYCQTSKGSPTTSDVVVNGDWLLTTIWDKWCCIQTPKKFCTRMRVYRTAATDVCGPISVCVTCAWAGMANRDIGLSCQKDWKSGGIKRRVVDTIWSPYQLEVNAYLYKK